MEKVYLFLKENFQYLIILITIIASIITLVSYFENKNPQIRFQILSSNTVLDVKENLSDLKIFYKEVELKKKKQTLWVTIVKILNDSKNNIRESDYSESDPLGIEIDKGKLIKAEIPNTSNEYLKEKLSVNLISEQSLVFPKIMLDGNDFFIVKLISIVQENNIPKIKGIGKISGIKNIPVDEIYKNIGKENVFFSVIKGNAIVQSLRIILYCALFYLGIFLKIEFDFWKTKRTKLNLIKKFKKEYSDLNFNNKDEFIFDTFLSTTTFLSTDILHEVEILKEFITNDEIRNIIYHAGNKIEGKFLKNSKYAIISYIELYPDFLEKGFVKKVNDSYKIDQHIKSTTIKFAQFVKEKGFPKNKK